MTGRIGFKIITFSAILICVLTFLSKLLSPTWLSWNNDDTTKEFYKEPHDTIQVVFLGTSQVVNGISPIEIYNRSGLCTYNLASEQQPLLSSLYRLKEAYRLHSKTLQAVVLDVSFLMYADEKESSLMLFNEKALSHLRLSSIKAESIIACKKQYGEEYDEIENLIPLLRYHTRWKELNRNDFRGVKEDINKFYTRGEGIDYTKALTTTEFNDMIFPKWDLTDSFEDSSVEYESFWTGTNKQYFKEIVSFCENKNLELLLIKLPKKWDNVQHDAVQYLANRYMLPFIDFNDGELQEEIGFSLLEDYRDRYHSNIYGARKISRYLSDYLTQNYNLESVRGKKKYDFLQKEADMFYLMYQDGWLQNINSLKGYLQALNKDRYSILIATKGEVTENLTDEEKEAMEDFGFVNFKNLKYNHAYAGVKSRGTVIADVQSESFRDRLLIDGRIDEYEGLSINTIINEKVTAKGEAVIEAGEQPYEKLRGYWFFSIYCGSASGGNFASLIFQNTERSLNQEGINILVYDDITRMLVDVSCFTPGTLGARRVKNWELINQYRIQVNEDKKRRTG